MLKLLLATVLLSIVQAAPPAPRHAANPAAQDANKINKNPAKDQQPVAPTPRPANVPEGPKADKDGSGKEASPNAEQSIRVSELPPVSVKKNWDWSDWILWFASTLLALAGICGIVLAYCTLKAIQKQTKAVLRAVVATRRQTAASMEAQSGRIALFWDRVVHIDYGPTRIVNGPLLHAFNWYCRNAGQTQIEILKTWSRLIAVDSLVNLPESPDYTAPNERTYIGEKLIPNTDMKTQWFSAILEETGLSFEEMQAKHRSGKCALYAYGYVIYRDVWGRERPHRFGVVRGIGPGIMEDNWVPAGPRAYNE